MFKRYECGCIGFVVYGMTADPDEKIIWLVKPCDPDGDREVGLSPHRSASLARKASEKLTETEVEDVLQAIRDLVVDGYKFRDLRSLLS